MSPNSHRAPMPFSAPGEPSTLDMTTPRDHLRWALSALELLRNGLKNRRKLTPNDVEMMNLTAATESVIEALRIIREQPGGPAGDGYRVVLDGNAWCATGPGFINLQESKAGFGHTPLVALGELIVEEGEP